MPFAARSRAAAEVHDATSVSLARQTIPPPLNTGLAPVGSPATAPAPVMQVVNFNGARPMALTDSMLINTHNAGLTHIDALSHIPVGDKVYPGVPIQDAVTPTGVRHASADHAAKGIVTRGILLDLAPDHGSLDADHRVSGTDLDAALDRAGTSVHPGDRDRRPRWLGREPAHDAARPRARPQCRRLAGRARCSFLYR
ncbi:cyclase family protein [Streptomyces sp. NPDC046716]|uniref:cyclase family protein n=1 Tax=Streptomyces sp. NPDC046716 TaxID=3157093 RepID=UPI0033D06096